MNLYLRNWGSLYLRILKYKDCRFARLPHTDLLKARGEMAMMDIDDDVIPLLMSYDLVKMYDYHELLDYISELDIPTDWSGLSING